MPRKSLTHFLGPRYWPTWLGLGIVRVIGFIPLPVIATFGYLLGYLFYVLGRSRRKIALTNIGACFPELSIAEQKRINRNHFMYAGQMVFASSMNWWSSVRRFNNWVSLHGREHYDKALANDQRIILLAPHFLALEVGGIYLAQERPITSMYQYSKNTLMDELIRRGRLRFGGTLIERKDPLRKLLTLIRTGQPFYYLPDQDAGRKGVFVPFFHSLASTIPMLGKFAKMTDAVVIPCRTEIKPWGLGYKVVLGEPMRDFPLGDDGQDATRMNQEIEQMVRESPEQYFWAHKRFKTQPKNNPKFYN